MDPVRRAFERTIKKLIFHSVEIGMPEVAEQFPDRAEFLFEDISELHYRVRIDAPLKESRYLDVIIMES